MLKANKELRVDSIHLRGQGIIVKRKSYYWGGKCSTVVTPPRLAIVVLKIRRLVCFVKLAVITEISQVLNVYLKILDKFIIMRCS